MKALGLNVRTIALVVVVAAATLARASGAASGTAFRSKEYHYSVTLPGGSDGWKLSPAVERWAGLTLIGSTPLRSMTSANRPAVGTSSSPIDP